MDAIQVSVSTYRSKGYLVQAKRNCLTCQQDTVCKTIPKMECAECGCECA